MILDNLILNTLLLVIFLIILNSTISKTKILLDDSSASNHKYDLGKNIIPLSGGIFLFSTIFYFNYNFKSEFLTLLYALPLLILGILSDKNILNSPILRLLLQAFFIFLAIKFLNVYIIPDRMQFIKTLLNNGLLNRSRL